MLVEPDRTQYDLKFRLFGFPIRIHPLFWLGAVLLGIPAMEDRPLTLLIWVAVVFVSILVHELGHAFAYRQFGTGSHIVLYVFGGLAVPWSSVSRRWRRILISLAGPFAGFILLAIVYFSNEAFGWRLASRPILYLYDTLVAVNLCWGVLNLLPVFPLDGGQVSRELCESASRRNGLRIALQISIVVAGLLAIYGLIGTFGRHAELLGFLPGWFPPGTLWTAILFVILAVQSYQVLQQVERAPGRWDYPDDDRPPWGR